MKILFLTLSNFSQFPAYKRAVGTGEALAILGHDVAISVMDCEENRLRMRMEAPHCKAVWFKKTGVLKELFSKLRIVWTYRPDILYSTSYSLRNLAYVRIFLPLKMRVIIEFCELYSCYGATTRTWKFLERFALLECSGILCASKVIENHFKLINERLRLNKRIIYLPYAYPSYLNLCTASGFNKKRNFVFMASLWVNYGVYDVIKAFRMLMQKYSDITLEIIGNGPEKGKVIKLVNDAGLEKQIFIRGYVPEELINEHLANASVFIAPLHDTIQDRARCPSKIYYYIPYERPIVTNSFSEPYEALGEYGFYYKADDIEDMSRAMGEALIKSDTFRYPKGFIARHSWTSRASEFINWLEDDCEKRN